MSSPNFTKDSSLALASVSLNRFGVMEYAVEEKTPDPTATYYETFKTYLEMPESEKAKYPPIPPPPSISSGAPTRTTLSLLETLPAPPQDSAGGVTSDGPDSPGGSGSTSTVDWRERSWQSRQIVLARQKITGWTGIFWDATVAVLLENIQTFVAEAAVDLGFNRDAFSGSVFVMQYGSDYHTLTNNLANSDVRGFYFYGHGSPSGNSIGFSEGTPNDGIIAKDLGAMLGNFYAPARNGRPASYVTHKPFSFVFLDGCMTGKGNFPDAFGIPKAVSGGTYLYNNKQKRAFMGWGGPVSLFILDSDFLDWTRKFWETWLNNPTETLLKDAIDNANAHYPSVPPQAPMLPYGTQLLKWGD